MNPRSLNFPAAQLACVALFAAAVPLAGAVRPEVAESFAKFEAHRGAYHSAAERERRLAVYAENHAAVEAHNAAGHPWKASLNRFADLTHDEWRAKMFGNGGARLRSTRPPPPDSSDATDARLLATLPDSVDWRTAGAVTPVKDQGAVWRTTPFPGGAPSPHRLAFCRPVRLLLGVCDCRRDRGRRRGRHGPANAALRAADRELRGALRRRQQRLLGRRRGLLYALGGQPLGRRPVHGERLAVSCAAWGDVREGGWWHLVQGPEPLSFPPSTLPQLLEWRHGSERPLRDQLLAAVGGQGARALVDHGEP